MTEIETLELDLEQLQERLTATQERLEELKKAKKREPEEGDVWSIDGHSFCRIIVGAEGFMHPEGAMYTLEDFKERMEARGCEYLGKFNEVYQLRSEETFTREQLKEKFAKIEGSAQETGKYCASVGMAFNIANPANFIDNLLDGKNDDGSKAV